jgi:hypothetical protein
LELGQIEKIVLYEVISQLAKFEIFRVLEVLVSYFASLNHLNIWKIFELKGKK